MLASYMLSIWHKSQFDQTAKHRNRIMQTSYDSPGLYISDANTLVKLQWGHSQPNTGRVDWNQPTYHYVSEMVQDRIYSIVMVLFPVTTCDPFTAQFIPFFTFYIVFHIFIKDGDRYFKFGR